MSNIIRINFNTSTSNTLHWKNGPGLPNWMKLVLEDFQKSYDSNFDSSYENHLYSEKGLKYVVNWLKSYGYKVAYWEMDFNTKPADNPYILAYGIEFQEDCEKFIELKLRATL